MKSGNLNFLEPSGPLQACNGTDLPLPLLFTFTFTFTFTFNLHVYLYLYPLRLPLPLPLLYPFRLPLPLTLPLLLPLPLPFRVYTFPSLQSVYFFLFLIFPHFCALFSVLFPLNILVICSLSVCPFQDQCSVLIIPGLCFRIFEGRYSLPMENNFVVLFVVTVWLLSTA